ncbi:efflux transporter outer membrane subunit [Candidatus Contendibacter odensensis]|uniref:RND efflux system, outer membrane lipoprotein, NodT family n=1 Tax=Candidatus Contendobacter odensis Run_B_J11 TaxID=1400861 RepID=A0A7U7GCF5_9GAMM|nr:efflux transporter outer membrane subunit [Candidatus Contendobacter odensis]CDH45508.1 RND efflux system, outer membrane lipoprotein, NodT family [Candidatus Contendobacter odensis Run_B_J11]
MRKISLILAIGIALGGCSLAPTYQRPEVPIPAQWQVNIQTANDLANTTWWNQFRDPVLDNLIQTALQENKDVQIAAARVEEYMGRYGVVRSEQFPQVGANAAGARTRASEDGALASGTNPVNTFQVDLGVSFELDLWGKLRNATEAARAQLLATEEAKRTVILTLVSQLANSYVQLLDLDRQLVVTRETLGTRSEAVRINGLRFKAGLISELDYQQAVAEYQNAAVQVPRLERLIGQQENAISLLLGHNPGKIARGITLDQLALPQVPGGLPSELLERRPDIRQAEQQLIAANALIGVAKAAFFPNISLTGFFGTASSDLSDLFKGPSQTWQFAGQLLQPIFTGGALTGQLQVAEAVQQQALLNYQQVIQKAFAEVDDSLIAISKLREQLKDQAAQVNALQRNVDLATLRYQNGYSDYLTVVDAERNLYAAQLQYVQDQGLLFTSLVNLYKALGGGWVTEAEQMSAPPVKVAASPSPAS